MIELLWDCRYAPRDAEPPADPSVGAALVALARAAAGGQPSSERGTARLRDDALACFAIVAANLAGAGAGPLHERLAVSFGRPGAAEVIRRALVLLADHELNASTFAARVTVSTGAPLGAGVLAGLAALGGPRHGNAASEVMALADDIEHQPGTAGAALLDWLGERRVVPGFGHRLYPRGDIRARVLMEAFAVPPPFLRLAAAGRAVLEEEPNIDFALAALTVAYELPPRAPGAIFALARSVGWLAHGLEQAAAGQLIRPRAHYVGRPPGASG